MKLREIIETLQATVVVNGHDQEMEVKRGCGSDLMSDVLHRLKPNALLLTGLTTPQSVYTAEMADLSVVCYVRGKTPDAEAVRLAEERGLVLLCTTLPLFESCGRLYAKGLRGDSEI